MIYLFVFTLSVLFTYLAQRTVCQKLFFYLFSMIAVLLPSLLAGFRDSGVGTDTLIYADDVWEKITYCDNWNIFFLSYATRVFDDIELLYLLINYLVYQLGGNLHTLYFMVNFIVVLFFYMTAYDNRKKASMWLVMAIFFLMYYNVSLNLIRQSIALSMCVYAFKYAENRRWRLLLIWCFLIVSTHNTGIFYIVFLVFYFVWNMKMGKLRNMVLVFFCFLLGSFFIAFDAILSLAVFMSFLPAKFLEYSSGNMESVIQKSYLLFYFVILLFFLLINRLNRNIVSSRIELSYYSSTKFVGFLLLITSLISKWAFRVSYYFNYSSDCVFLPRALHILKKRNRNYYMMAVLCLLLFCIIMWFWIIVYRNENETYPYRSKILGIN